MPNTLRFVLQPSTGLTWLLAAAHAGAAALVWLVLPGWYGKVLASSALGASLAVGLRRHARRWGPAAIVELELNGDGSVTLRRKDGRDVSGRLLASTFVSPRLVILNLATQARWLPLAVLVPADAVPPEDHRRLRVWLRWRGDLVLRAERGRRNTHKPE